MPRQRKTSSQPIGAGLLQSDFIVNNKTKVFHTLAAEKIIDEAMPLLRAKKERRLKSFFARRLRLSQSSLTCLTIWPRLWNFKGL